MHDRSGQRPRVRMKIWHLATAIVGVAVALTLARYRAGQLVLLLLAEIVLTGLASVGMVIAGRRTDPAYRPVSRYPGPLGCVGRPLVLLWWVLCLIAASIVGYGLLLSALFTMMELARALGADSQGGPV
jgi:hypothetical protein